MTFAAAAAGGVLANRAAVDAETKLPEPAGGRIVGPLHVLEEGAGDPLVLLHGFAGSARWFDDVVPLLRDRHRVIRIDLLGHGGSAKPLAGYEMEHQAKLVAGVLDELGVGSARVVGHSMGAAVAVALAEQRPALVADLILLDEGPDNSFGSLPFLAKLGFAPVLGQLLHRVVPDALVRDGYADAFAPGYDFAALDVVGDYRRMTFTSYKDSADLEDRFLASERLDARLQRLGRGALVVFGEQDRVFRATECAQAFKALPGVRVELLDGVGHSPNVEAPEQLAALLA